MSFVNREIVYKRKNRAVVRENPDNSGTRTLEIFVMTNGNESKAHRGHEKNHVNSFFFKVISQFSTKCALKF